LASSRCGTSTSAGEQACREVGVARLDRVEDRGVLGDRLLDRALSASERAR